MLKNKIKILRIIHTLDPASGGPQNAILDNTISLQKLGIKVDILTGDNKKINLPKLKKIKVFNKGTGWFGDYGFNIKLFLWLLKNKDNYDYFIVHGLWSFYTLASRILLHKKYFVFVHGQLDPYFAFDGIKKIKKIIYWILIERQNLLSSKSLLLTSTIEKQLLDKTFVNTNGITKTIVKYGILNEKINKKKVTDIFYENFPYLKKKNFLLFLGRFHDKKGCDILIKSLNKLATQNIRLNILLAGPDNEYKDELKNLSKKYKLEKNLFWSDAIFGDIKSGAILASKGMVLASHGENFGVSLVESLSLNRPVITTNKVNIYKQILKYKAGLISNNNVNDFSKILKQFYLLNKKQILKMSNNSYRCFDENFNLSKKDKNFYKLLNSQ